MATFQIRYGISTATGSSLKAGELYAATDLQTLQLSTDGVNSITLMSSASIVQSISSSLENTIIGLSQSLANDLSTSIALITFDSSSLESTILNLSASIYQTDATQTNNITTNSASAWGAYTSASSYSASLQTTIDNVSQSISTSLSNLSESLEISILNVSQSISSSLNLVSSSLQTSISTSTAEYTSFSASTYTTLNSISQSISGTINTLSISVASRLYDIEFLDTTYATTGSNTFIGTQIISGSTFIAGDLIVQGTSSIQNITGSILDIGTNQILLNTATPEVRFAGISVQDSGSNIGVTGSLWWDSINNNWIYQHESGSIYSGGILLSGPRNTGSLGQEVGLTKGQVPVSAGDDHLNDSIISASATKVTIAGDLDTTGNVSASTITGIGNITDYSSSIDSRIIITSASVWGAFQSASVYSSSFRNDINILSSSIYQTDATQSNNINTNSASVWGAFQSASSYSSSLVTSISNLSSSVYSTYVQNAKTSSMTAGFATYASNIALLIDNVDTTLYPVFSANVAANGYTTLRGNSTGSIYYNSTTQKLYANSFVGAIEANNGIISSSAQISALGFDNTASVQTISASAWGAYTSASSYSASLQTTVNNITQNVLINSQSAWGAYTSASSYSSSLQTSISASNHRIDILTYNAGAQLGGDNTFTGQNIFSQYITGSISGSNVQTNTLNVGDITASGNLYVSGTIYTYELHTIIESSSVIFSSGSNQIGDQLTDVLTVTGSINQTGSTSFSELSGSLFDFSASLNSRFNNNTTNITTLSSSIYQTDATQSNNINTNSASVWGAFQSASFYSASAATSISASLVSQTSLSESIALTDSIQTNNITINSQSAWGAFQSASAYSASIYQTDITQSSTIVTQGILISNVFASASAYSASAAVVAQTNANSAAGAFASASAYSASLTTTITNNSSSAYTSISASNVSITTLSSSAANALSSYSSSASTIYAKVGATNTFTANQIISGSLTVTGDVVAYSPSDERLKDNIQLISNPIEKVQQLRGVEFDWNDKVQSKAGTHDYGIIAQDVLKVFPELIKQRYDGYYGVDYDKLVSLLIEVVKVQEERIKNLENKLNQ